MRTHSFDRMILRPPHVAFAAFAAVAALTAFAAPNAWAKSGGGTITVTTDRDTARVREITIDDEGIRIIGGHKKGGHPDLSSEIEIDRDPTGHRVIRIQHSDSTFEPVVIGRRGDNEIVQFFHDAHVEKGETVSTVVALLGNVKNEGVITGDCVSILGSIVLGDSAVILGDAVSVGGMIQDAADGSRIEGETVSIPFLPFSPIAMPGAFGLLLFGLVSFALFVGLAAIAGRLFPDRLIRISETISARTLLSLVLGLLSVPLACVMFVLLLVTVIGIPLAIMLPLLFVLAAFVGYVASAYLLGTKLLGRRLDAAGGLFAPILAGTAFATVFYLLGIPFLSGEGFVRVIGVMFLAIWFLIGTVYWTLGFGAILLSRLGQAPRSPESQWYPSIPSEPRPTSAPATAAPPVPPTAT